MLYIGHLIIVNGQDIKKPVLGISIFELHRLENCIGTLCPGPIGDPPPKKTPKHTWKTHKEGLKHSLHSIFYHFEGSSEYQKKLKI